MIVAEIEHTPAELVQNLFVSEKTEANELCRPKSRRLPRR